MFSFIVAQSRLAFAYLFQQLLRIKQKTMHTVI